MKHLVKVTFSKCPIPNRKEYFKKSSCIMPISVGQQLQVHEGKKFAGTMNLVNLSFKRCTLLIDDTIQRHTMKIFSKQSDEVLTRLCLEEGNKWLERNKEIYDSLSIEHNILRWNDWITHPLYIQKFILINKLYTDNKNYREAVSATIDEYIARLLKRNHAKFCKKTAPSYCLEYLLEEYAVMCLWAHEGYDFELYPTGRNYAMASAYEHIIKNEYRSSKLT